MGSDATVAFGKSGEDLACDALEREGYAICARRYRTRGGEIDIIAEERGVLVFVEVKTRSSLALGHPAESVTPWKQRRIVTMAQHFVARYGVQHLSCRFDVVSILWPAGERPVVEVLRDAFRPD
jgi:putative endonuclease